MRSLLLVPWDLQAMFRKIRVNLSATFIRHYTFSLHCAAQQQIGGYCCPNNLSAHSKWRSVVGQWATASHRLWLDGSQIFTEMRCFWTYFQGNAKIVFPVLCEGVMWYSGYSIDSWRIDSPVEKFDSFKNGPFYKNTKICCWSYLKKC